MLNIHSGIQNVINGQGIKIAISGMLIVFAALAIISFFIYILPFILKGLVKILPPEGASHGFSASPEAIEDEVLAAIGFALHTEIGGDIPVKGK